MRAELKYARTGEPDTPCIIEPNFVSVLLAFPGKHFGDISAQHNEVPELTALYIFVFIKLSPGPNLKQTLIKP